MALYRVLQTIPVGSSVHTFLKIWFLNVNTPWCALTLHNACQLLVLTSSSNTFSHRYPHQELCAQRWRLSFWHLHVALIAVHLVVQIPCVLDCGTRAVVIIVRSFITFCGLNVIFVVGQFVGIRGSKNI